MATMKLSLHISRRRQVQDLGRYFDCLRASVPGVHIPQRCKALDWTRRPKQQPKPAAPPPQAGHLPGRGSNPRRGDLAKAPAPPAPEIITRAARVADDAEDDVVAPEVAAWWNKQPIEVRCYFMGRANSLEPEAAYQAYQDALARAEEAKAAERTHQDVVAKARAAKAAAVGAASRIITNGVGAANHHH